MRPQCLRNAAPEALTGTAHVPDEQRGSSDTAEAPHRGATTPSQPPLSPVLTLLFGVVLLACILFIVWLQVSVPPLDRVPVPERALLLIVERMMDLEERLASVPRWERLLYEGTAGSEFDELEQALDWYEELAAFSGDPLVHLQLAVLEAEAGRLESVRRKLKEWDTSHDPFPMFAAIVRAAYLEERVDPASKQILHAELAEAVPAGWFYDRMVMHLAERSGDQRLWVEAKEALQHRGDLLLTRVRVLSAGEVGLTLLGMGTLAIMIRRRTEGYMIIGTSMLPPPWSGWQGLAVLVQGGAVAAVLTLLFLVLDLENVLLRLLSMPLASLPLLLMAYRHLLVPAALGYRQALGFQLVPGGLARLALAVPAVLGVGFVGDWVLGWGAEWLELESHWTEWFDADLVWGDQDVMIVSLVEYVLIAPVLEEVVFRGLLYATLRRQFGLGLSAVMSSAVFALAHGYGVLGFASVFWSGIVWAWVYEKTGSLLPGLLGHALNNLLVCLTIISMLRV